jgi:SWIM zinc finger
MYVLNRTRSDNEEIFEEVVDIVGTTGNIYKVRVNNEPTCSCPDAAKGNQCKHIIYVGAVTFDYLLFGFDIVNSSIGFSKCS